MERSNRNKKSSKKPLILGVSALVLIAAAGGGYYAYSQWQAKQELAEAKKTATTFLNVLSKQEFDKLPSVVQEASLKKMAMILNLLLKNTKQFIQGFKQKESKLVMFKSKRRKTINTHLPINYR